MYHHICPKEKIPASNYRPAIEGWKFSLEPKDFEFQLNLLLRRGFQFISFNEYVKRCKEDSLNWGAVSVTFDDGWLDNYQYAFPILHNLGIPATIFVVSGEMAQVPHERRMSDVQMRELAENGMTIGAHSSTHQNLVGLSAVLLPAETKGCKDGLEQRLGRPVEYFAYPGGRFDHRTVEALQSAGFKAACSIIGGGLNGRHNLFWLYRDVFSREMTCLRDRLFLNGFARKLLNERARLKADTALKNS